MKEINFSPELKSLLTRCPIEAARFNLSTISPSVVLLLLLEDPRSTVCRVIDKIALTSAADLRSQLQASLQEQAGASQAGPAGMDPRTERALRLSALEAGALRSSIVCPEHLLLGIFHTAEQQSDSYIDLFSENNVTYSTLQGALRQMCKSESANEAADEADSPSMPYSAFDSSDDDDEEAEAIGGDDSPREQQRTGARKGTRKTTDTPALDKFGVDMTRAAEEDRLDPVVGRETEIERLAQILSRRKKNNPVLIGEPGVGKSAIVEGLALRIVQRKVPRVLFDKRVVSLDMASIVAGTKYRGQFEERVKAILDELAKNKDIILFIDELQDRKSVV